MRQINIYIDTLYAGSLVDGCGTCSIVLECHRRDGQIATAEHYARWSSTTKNRLAVLAMIEAMLHITVPCRIRAYIDNPLLTTMVNDGMLAGWYERGWVGSRGDEIKNADLLQKLMEQLRGQNHELILENVKETSYSRYMRQQMEKRLAAGLIPERMDRVYEQQRMEALA